MVLGSCFKPLLQHRSYTLKPESHGPRLHPSPEGSERGLKLRAHRGKRRNNLQGGCGQGVQVQASSSSSSSTTTTTTPPPPPPPPAAAAAAALETRLDTQLDTLANTRLDTRLATRPNARLAATLDIRLDTRPNPDYQPRLDT